MAIAQSPQPISIEALASMTPDAQASYIAGLPLDQQAMVQAALARVNQTKLLQAGADYLARTIDKLAVCPVANSAATSASWPTGGGTIQFICPQISNGWLRAYRIRVSVTVTNAAGTSAIYALTPAGVLGLFPEVAVQYGNTTQRYPLRVWQDLKQLKSKLEPLPWEPVLGSARALTNVNNYLFSSSFPVATGANTWSYEVEIPMNLVHSLDPRGMVPISGGLTQPIISLTCNAAPFGADSMKNALYAVSGSGHSSTVTGTIAVYACYRDGDTLTQRAKMAFDPGNLGTIQFGQDGTLNSLAANTAMGYQLKKIGRHYWVLAYVIDAQASSAFSADDNITQLDIVKDSGGTNALWRVGGDSNVSVYEFYSDIRRDIKQDLPYGVVPFVYATAMNTVSADNQDGIAVFDNTPGNGWPAAQFRAKVTTVGSVGSGPRVEFYTVYENQAGLQIVG